MPAGENLFPGQQGHTKSKDAMGAGSSLGTSWKLSYHSLHLPMAYKNLFPHISVPAHARLLEGNSIHRWQHPRS